MTDITAPDMIESSEGISRQKVQHQSQFQLALRTFARDRMATISLTVIVIVSLISIFAPLLAP